MPGKDDEGAEPERSDEDTPGFRVVSGYVRVGSGGLGGRGVGAGGGDPVPPEVEEALLRKPFPKVRLRCQLCGIVKETVDRSVWLQERRLHEKAAHPDMDARRIQLQQELFDMERALWGVGVEYIEDGEEQAP